MSNLENFNNLYANLAESAYNDRPTNFPPYANLSTYKEIDFSQDYLNEKTGKLEVQGGTNLPNNGVVYLQSDKSGALTNAKAGYNAYFVTDQPSVSDSRETYSVTDDTKLIQALSFFIFRKFSKRGHTVNF